MSSSSAAASPGSPPPPLPHGPAPARSCSSGPSRVAGPRPTRRTAPDGRRFLFNRGAHALYQAAGLEVLHRLGINPSGGPPPVGKGKVRYRGEMHTFPSNARTMATTSLLGLRGKSRLAALLARIHKLDPAELTGFTTEDWIVNLDLPEAAEAFVRTVVRTGTYSVAFDLLDAGAALASVQGAVKGVLYLDGGFQQLVDGLAAVARAAGVEIRRPRLSPTAGSPAIRTSRVPA